MNGRKLEMSLLVCTETVPICKKKLLSSLVNLKCHINFKTKQNMISQIIIELLADLSEEVFKEGFFKYCLNRSSKACPMVLMTSWAIPLLHSNMWQAARGHTKKLQ